MNCSLMFDHHRRALCLVAAVVSLIVPPTLQADDFPEPVNTQAPGEHPPSPVEMLSLIDLPEGFQVTLFAGEPAVQQPVAFDFDDRGRIWVAENYTYSAHGQIDPNLRDRIVILQDNDGDGRHDERRVFWDKGSMLTGLTWGFGGLWVLNDGSLSFIPDRNGDDVPDSDPVEMLNGWTKTAGHNFVNGLMWGPDGWLYGRHGITDSSLPGTPDTPKDERQPMNCGIWRFHPTRHTFEVVCNGTTNPWGLDYDRHGQFFFTNNVIGHLWHVVPGAHYERMFGQDFNPHLYELMSQTADHYHWDTTGKWSDSRDGKADDLGGGHSHCGGMIYQGTNFPEAFRNRIFMCNTHGRCVNVERLERSGSGYVGKHEANLLKVNTPWFRGVELKYGPRGEVYVSDWSDNGECHDHDGVHRTSGRLYCISYGPVAELKNPLDLTTLNEQQLMRTAVFHESEWHARRARRLLQERITKDSRPQIVSQLSNLAEKSKDERHLIRIMHLLASVDGLSEVFLRDHLKHSNEFVAALAVRLAADSGLFRVDGAGISPPTEGIDPGASGDLLTVAETTTSGLVLLHTASALQRMDDRTRRNVARILIHRDDAVRDRHLELMTWYGIVNEPSPAGFLYMLDRKITSPRLAEFVARRIVQLTDQADVVLQQLLSVYGPTSAPELQQAVLTGMSEGLRGQFRPKAPPSWDSTSQRLLKSDRPDVVQLTRELSVLFGDGRAISDLRAMVADRDGDGAARSQAILALAEAGDQESLKLFFSLLSDRAVYVAVAKALASYDDERIPQELLKRWSSLRHGSKEAAVDTLCSRPAYGRELTQALETGQVESSDLTAAQVRQLLSFNVPEITSILEARWGVINESSEARAAAIEKWRQALTPEVLAQADHTSGAALFKKSCGTCHRLYGEGGQIGPDLTGSNRSNPDYLLGNIIDPSAVVPKQFTVSVIALTSGRVITGVVVSETDQTVTVQTEKELLPIALEQIEERTLTTKSLMPDGLLDSLTPDQVRDLFAFVMQRR